MREALDTEIWNYALANEYIIVTKDEDFVHRSLSAKYGPQVLWLRIGNSTNRELVQWLGPILTSIVAELAAGQRIVEARR